MEIVRSTSVTADGTLKIFEELRDERWILVFDCDEESRETVFHALCRTEDSAPITALTRICHCVEEIQEHLDFISARSIATEATLVWGLKPPYNEDIEILRDLRSRYPMARVVLLAQQEALEFATEIRAVKAEVFILKPFQGIDIQNCIEKSMARLGKSTAFAPKSSRVHLESKKTKSFANTQPGFDLGLIGESPEIRKVIDLIRKVGPSRVNVLITGESGTGKEMVAQALHSVSGRAKKPFVAVNCAAIPRELLESELFGHTKGAFTGAVSSRRGLFEEAHEGTILLDEIGDLPLQLQSKILRLLQTREVKPLGQNTSREVDVRIISATHKNLKALIQKGEFREDLYYRLNVMPIPIPALRERGADVLLLADYFLRRHAERSIEAAPTLNAKAANRLQNLSWRGNVRELENVIDRAIVLSDGMQITEDEILFDMPETLQFSAEDLFNAGLSLRDIEREYIKYVLMKVGHRKEAATKILGIDRKTLYRKERAYGLCPPSSFN